MSEGMQSPLFVGRREEMATLVALLRRAGEGEPGFTVLVGRCPELGAERLPLAPLTDAPRTLTRTMGPGDLTEVLGPARRGLGRLLPELDPMGVKLGTPTYAGWQNR